MEIFDLAKELGRVLREDPRLIALEQAKKAYEDDSELKKALVEYEVQQKAMQNEAGKPDRDLHFIELIQSRIDALYRQITESPAFAELNRAQGEVNALMNQVNQTIMTEITGEEPASGCTHNCSTCGGCR